MEKSIKLLFLLLMFFVKNISSQELESFVRTSRLTGSGTMGKNIEIIMTLDLIKRIEYSADRCIIKDYNQIVGTYSYIKHGGSIQLIGQKINWSFKSDDNISDSIILYELNTNYDKTAIFKGTLTKSSFTGTWINLKNNKKIPFQIKFNKNYFSNLSILYKGDPITLMGFETNSFQSTCELINKIEKNDTLYIITRTIEPCCGYYNCRGTNCGGNKEYLILNVLTKNFQKYYKELISSDCDWCEIVNTTKTIDAYGVVIENRNEKFIIKIDYKNLNKGIQKIKIK